MSTARTWRAGISAFAVVITAVVVALVATAASASKLAKPLIGESSPVGSNPNQQAITNGQRIAARKYGFAFKTLDANLSADKQVSDIDSLVSQGAKGITSWTLDPGAADAAYSRAAKSGAIVVGFNSVSRFITTTVAQQTDFATRGSKCAPFKNAARYIAARIPHAKVFVIGGPPVPSIGYRVDCFTAAANTDGLDIVAKQNNVKDTAATAQPIVQDMFTRHPDVQAIWTSNEPSTMGAAAAMSSTRKKVWSGGTKGVIIIGNNGSQDAISAIKAHKMSVTYDGNSPQAGAMAVWAIAEKLKKHKRPPKLIVVKSTRYDSSNVNKYVPALKRKVNLPPL